MAFLKANIAELRCRSVGLWSKNEASTANLYNDYHSALKKKKKKVPGVLLSHLTVEYQ